MLSDFSSEFHEKLQDFTTESNSSSLVSRQIPFNILSDDLFVKMMINFAMEKHFDTNRKNDLYNALLACIKDFSPDGIVMHWYMTAFLVNDVDYTLPFDNCNYSDMRFTLYGIRTVLCRDDEFPYDKILMIRNGEPNPTSMLLSFKAV